MISMRSWGVVLSSLALTGLGVASGAPAASQQRPAQVDAPPIAERPEYSESSYELTLADAIALARDRAPEIASAAARVRVTRGSLLDARRPIPENPRLTAEAGPRFSSDELDFDVGLGIEQTLRRRGARDADVRAAEADVSRAARSVHEAEQAAMRRAAVAFIDARYAQERLDIAREREALAEELLSVATRRNEAGAAGLVEVRLATVTLERARAQAAHAAVEQSEALAVLRTALALEPDAELELAGPLFEARRFALDELVAGISERPDIRRLDAAIEAAEARIAVGDAAGRPQVTVGVGYAREERAHRVGATLGVDLPIVDMGAGTRHTAAAQAEALAIERAAVEQSARIGIMAAHDRYRRLVAAIDRFEQAGLPAVPQTESLARSSYEAGASDLDDLLAIRRELVGALHTYAELRFQAARARIALEAEAGILR